MQRPIITIDLEEWFHLIATDALPHPESWPTMDSRVHANTHRLLDILAKHDIKATFFCLGWVAEHHPGLIRTILQAGHEVGCHSHLHTPVHQQSEGSFRQETSRALMAIQDAGSTSVCSYRAPGFSITSECLWAFPVLAELGILNDASCFPGKHSHGGLGRTIPREPFRIKTPGGVLKEFPVTVIRLPGVELPSAGGGYFRLMPFPILWLLARNESYLMTYFHPRDFDPGQPILKGLSPMRYFKSYVGLGSAIKKFEKFLADFGGQSLCMASIGINWDSMVQLELNGSSLN